MHKNTPFQANAATSNDQIDDGRKVIDVALAVAWRLIDEKAVPSRTQVLLTLRPENVHCGGLWEFPGGKIHGDELPHEAARRELAEETGLASVRIDPVAVLEHDYPDRSVRLHVFLTQVEAGEEPTVAVTYRWVEADDLERWPMPEANRLLLRLVQASILNAATR